MIYVEYDPSEGKIRFRKNKGPYAFELPIDFPPLDDAYHPCVGLLSV